MRVILKPGGILMLIGAMLVLIVAALLPQFFNKRGAARFAVPIADVGGDAWLFSQLKEGSSENSIQPAGGPEGKPALKMVVKTPDPKTSWHVQAYCGLNREFKKGEKWELHFKGRSPEQNKMQAVFELIREPFTSELNKPVSLTKEWTAYSFPFVVKNQYAPREAKVGFQVGLAEGTYEFADVELVRVAEGFGEP